MNAEKLLALADRLEASETYKQSTFMRQVGLHCGSPGCIAGHAVEMESGWALRLDGEEPAATTVAVTPDGTIIGPYRRIPRRPVPYEER